MIIPVNTNMTEMEDGGVVTHLGRWSFLLNGCATSISDFNLDEFGLMVTRTFLVLKGLAHFLKSLNTIPCLLTYQLTK